MSKRKHYVKLQTVYGLADFSHFSDQCEHACILGYTTDDDGVYLKCCCGWRKCIGFNSTPEYARLVALEHRQIAYARKLKRCRTTTTATKNGQQSLKRAVKSLE